MARRPLRPAGAFITLEGGEGAGKSTQAEALARLLRDAGYAVTVTREPGGTELGRLLHGIFQRRESPAVSARAELLLFEAARAQHVAELIRPALERGEIVICDRFTDSSLAYQGYGRGLDLDEIEAANRLASGGLIPDLTLLLDLPPEMGLARKAHERTADSIGGESLGFHRRVREGYLAFARREPERIVVLDATGPEAETTRTAWEEVQRLLARRTRKQQRPRFPRAVSRGSPHPPSGQVT